MVREAAYKMNGSHRTHQASWGDVTGQVTVPVRHTDTIRRQLLDLENSVEWWVIDGWISIGLRVTTEQIGDSEVLRIGSNNVWTYAFRSARSAEAFATVRHEIVPALHSNFDEDKLEITAMMVRFFYTVSNIQPERPE